MREHEVFRFKFRGKRYRIMHRDWHIVAGAVVVVVTVSLWVILIAGIGEIYVSS